MAAQYLLDDLQAHFPETCKVPGRHGGYIRVPVSVNACWYRRLCSRHKVGRRRYPKPRTIIKRCHTIKALHRIIAGNTDGVYAERLMPFVEEMQE